MILYNSLGIGVVANKKKLNLKTMFYEKENKIIEAPFITIDDSYNEEKTLVLHNYINQKGKMVLTKVEASLLLIELYKFVRS